MLFAIGFGHSGASLREVERATILRAATFCILCGSPLATSGTTHSLGSDSTIRRSFQFLPRKLVLFRYLENYRGRRLLKD